MSYPTMNKIMNGGTHKDHGGTHKDHGGTHKDHGESQRHEELNNFHSLILGPVSI